MVDRFLDVWAHGIAVYLTLLSGNAHQLVMKFAPFVLILEMPLYIITWLGLMHYLWRRHVTPPTDIPYFPRVSCICNAYAEGRDVQYSVRSLLEQIYPGHIELVLVLDGAVKNNVT